MTYLILPESEVCSRWTLFYPMEPQERVYEWQVMQLTLVKEPPDTQLRSRILPS